MKKVLKRLHVANFQIDINKCEFLNHRNQIFKINHFDKKNQNELCKNKSYNKIKYINQF